MNEEELRFWAEAHAPAGSAVAKAVLCLFEKLASSDAKAIAERIVDAHEDGTLIAKWILGGCPIGQRIKQVLDRAPEMRDIGSMENVYSCDENGVWRRNGQIVANPFPKTTFDGSTGTPKHGNAGFINPPSPGTIQ